MRHRTTGMFVVLGGIVLALCLARFTMAEEDNLDETLAECNKAIEADPDNATLYVNRGRVWLAKHDADRALDDFNEAVRLDVNLANAYAARAVAWMKKDELDKAMSDLDEAVGSIRKC